MLPCPTRDKGSDFLCAKLLTILIVILVVIIIIVSFIMAEEQIILIYISVVKSCDTAISPVQGNKRTAGKLCPMEPRELHFRCTSNELHMTHCTFSQDAKTSNSIVEPVNNLQSDLYLHLLRLRQYLSAQKSRPWIS
jgi:hypothetical protein